MEKSNYWRNEIKRTCLDYITNYLNETGKMVDEDEKGRTRALELQFNDNPIGNVARVRSMNRVCAKKLKTLEVLFFDKDMNTIPLKEVSVDTLIDILDYIDGSIQSSRES